MASATDEKGNENGSTARAREALSMLGLGFVMRKITEAETRIGVKGQVKARGASTMHYVMRLSSSNENDNAMCIFLVRSRKIPIDR